MGTYLSVSQLTQDTYRSFRGYGLGTYDLRAFYPLSNEAKVESSVSIQLNERSQYLGPSYSVNKDNVDTSTITFETLTTLSLYLWADVALCKGIKFTDSELDRAAMRGDYLSTKL